jgi:hypothetical protein
MLQRDKIMLWRPDMRPSRRGTRVVISARRSGLRLLETHGPEKVVPPHYRKPAPPSERTAPAGRRSAAAIYQALKVLPQQWHVKYR